MKRFRFGEDRGLNPELIVTSRLMPVGLSTANKTAA